MPYPLPSIVTPSAETLKRVSSVLMLPVNDTSAPASTDQLPLESGCVKLVSPIVKEPPALRSRAVDVSFCISESAMIKSPATSKW